MLVIFNETLLPILLQRSGSPYLAPSDPRGLTTQVAHFRLIDQQGRPKRHHFRVRDVDYRYRPTEVMAEAGAFLKSAVIRRSLGDLPSTMLHMALLIQVRYPKARIRTSSSMRTA